MPRGSQIFVDEEYISSIHPDGSMECNRYDRSIAAPQLVQLSRGLYRRNGFVFKNEDLVGDAAAGIAMGFLAGGAVLLAGSAPGNYQNVLFKITS